MTTVAFLTAPKIGARRTARIDERASDVRLDQYYTRPDIAEHFYAVFREHFDPTEYQMVEPSAGSGSFSQLLPAGSLAFDVQPKCIHTADLLTVRIKSGQTSASIASVKAFIWCGNRGCLRRSNQG